MAVDCLKFHINGKWLTPGPRPVHHVINPATEKVYANISMGNTSDVDTAVAAARISAFIQLSQLLYVTQ